MVVRFSLPLNPKNEWVILADLIDWEQIEKDFLEHFEKKDTPEVSVRLIIGLLILQRIDGISDEKVIKKWLEIPYWQYFCGFDKFQWTLSIDALCLSKWKTKIREKGLQKILYAMFRLASDIVKLYKPIWEE